MDTSKKGFDTKLIHGGDFEDAFGSAVTPIYQTSTFAFKSAEHGAKLFKGEEKGFIYTRLNNPTIEALEVKLAQLENGFGGIALASGMAAVTTVYTAILKTGDHMISSNAVYGPSRGVMESIFAGFGVESSYIDTSKLESIKSAIKPNTKMLYLETPANPTMTLTDIEEACKIAINIQKLLDRGVAAKEIAVLYRVNVLSRSIEEGLNRSGIGYKLVGGQRFFDRAEVKDLISYLRVVTNPHDDFSIKRIVNKPKRGLGKASVDKIELAAHANETSIYEYIKNSDIEVLITLVKKKNATTLKNFVSNLDEVARVAKESTYEFIDVLEDTFHLKDIYKGMQDEEDRVRNMDEFYGLFRDFIKKSPDVSIDEFLNELTLQSEQDQVEGESIYMMSIHASKGLEFEHVFIIGMEEGFLPLVGDGSDLEEERRLGYVSMTRAKDSLTLSHAGSRFYKGRRSDLGKSRFFNEAGLCEGSLIVTKNTAFKKGDLVRHKIFGTGRINGVSRAGKEFKLSINFAGAQREILASFVERL